MGTTKLTRKEILAEDPIHAAMVRIIEIFRSRGNTIAIIAGGTVLVAAGIYFGLRYLESREMNAQEQLSRGIAFYHAVIDPQAPDDPFGKGPQALFKTEEARYKAASQVFSSVIAEHGSSKLAVIARYYLGLCQMRLGQNDQAIRNLEEVRNNTSDRTIGYLAKKVLATYYTETGNNREAASILEGMIKDPQCELPKDVLRVDLAKVYLASGKREEAQKLLKEAREEPKPSMLSSIMIKEIESLEKTAPVSASPKPE